jgi:hypothetical protein
MKVVGLCSVQQKNLGGSPFLSHIVKMADKQLRQQMVSLQAELANLSA